MEWLKQLHGTIIGLDTAPLIYIVEENPGYIALVELFFDAVEHGDFQAVTSSLTITEVLVQPLRRGKTALARKYAEILLNSRNLTTIPVSAGIANEGARLRAQFGLKTPDAIQVATARHVGASAFLTNDAEFERVTGLKVLVLNKIRSAPKL